MGRYTKGSINTSGLYVVEGVNYGNIGMIGKSTGTASINTAYLITNPDDAKTLFGIDSALYNSIIMAFGNGATKVWAVPIDDSQPETDPFTGDGSQTEFTLTEIPAQPLDTVTVDSIPQTEGEDFYVDYGNKKVIFYEAPADTLAISVGYGHHALADVNGGLDVLVNKDVQIVVGAMIFEDTLLTPIKTHVIGSVNSKRIGCYMLKNGETAVTLATTLASFRSLLIAHKSLKDAASALAGRIAGYKPSRGMTGKPLELLEQSEGFTPTEIAAFDDVHIITAFDPPKFTGDGEVISTGWTLDETGTMPFIDLVRVADYAMETLDRNYNSPAVIDEIPMNLEGMIQLDQLTASVLNRMVTGRYINGFNIVNEARTLFAEGTDIATITLLQTSRRLEDAYKLKIGLIIRAYVIFIEFEVALQGGV